MLTDAGRTLLAEAYRLWVAEHGALEAALDSAPAARATLDALAGLPDTNG